MKRITLYITEKQYKELLERSKKIETTMSEQIRRAIQRYLECKK